jgi:hypothetical protein
MTDPVTFTLAEAWWWIVGTFAMAGLAVCLFEAYYCIAVLLYDLRRYLTRRRDA